MPNWKELIIYVHGITAEAEINDPSKTYDDFHAGVKAVLGTGEEFGAPVKIRWGWDWDRDGKYKSEDERLAEAEEKIYGEVKKSLDKTRGFFTGIFTASVPVFNWFHLGLPTFGVPRMIVDGFRSTMLRGVADMFYYVSEDGRNTVRNNVFNTVLKELKALRISVDNDETYISLTCVGHSAGTVILYDILYKIFSQVPLKDYDYIDADDKKFMETVCAWAKAGKLRLRKLYTFGSPITLLLCRSNKTLGMIGGKGAPWKKFQPEQIGIKSSAELSNPRWVNFYDHDDVISYPVEFLFDLDEKIKVIEDKFIDVSNNPLEAHGKYWENKDIIKYVAQTWLG